MPITSHRPPTRRASRTPRIELLRAGPDAGRARRAPLGRSSSSSTRRSSRWRSRRSGRRKNQKKAASAPPATLPGPRAAEADRRDVLRRDALARRRASCSASRRSSRRARRPSSSKGGNTPSAPWVRFKWGVLSGFVGYIKSVSAKYTLFSPTGKPLRAVCTVALEELADEPGKQNPTSGGLQPRRVHTLREGDSLAGDRLPRVRRPRAVALARRGQRHRRPDAAAPGARRAPARRRGARRTPTAARSSARRSRVPAA